MTERERSASSHGNQTPDNGDPARESNSRDDTTQIQSAVSWRGTDSRSLDNPDLSGHSPDWTLDLDRDSQYWPDDEYLIDVSIALSGSQDDEDEDENKKKPYTNVLHPPKPTPDSRGCGQYKISNLHSQEGGTTNPDEVHSNIHAETDAGSEIKGANVRVDGSPSCSSSGGRQVGNANGILDQDDISDSDPDSGQEDWDQSNSEDYDTDLDTEHGRLIFL